MDSCSQASTSSALSDSITGFQSLNAVKQTETSMQLDYVGNSEMLAETCFERISSQNQLSDDDSPEVAPTESSDRDESLINGISDDRCRVCGDAQAKMHYGVLACFGCKGFFRRALKRASQYECSNGRKCVIDKFERNSCRYCRLQRCLEVGMDPAAVRPDRDFTGPQHAIRLPIIVKRPFKEGCRDQGMHNETSEWSKRLPVEMRTMLMNLLNIEAKVTKGDTKKKAHEVYPLPEHTLRELIEDPSKLKGLRTEMRYEPYRMAANSELLLIAYRRLIAAVDWVTYLSEMMNGISVDDKIALVKSCFAPLLVFTFAVRTAEVTDDPDVLCLCTFSFVPRDMAKAYTDSYHLSNGLVDRALNELVTPLRNLKLKQEESVCLSATIVLNPHAKDLSPEGSQKVIELRSRIQDTLYHLIKETRSKDRASVQFGNLLLFLPNVTLIANSMSENLQFAQTFSQFGGIPLLTNLFGCFPVEPFNDTPLSAIQDDQSVETDNEESDEDMATYRRSTLVNVATQTDPIDADEKKWKRKRIEPSLLSPVENPEHRDFKLLQPPGVYTLTEMFDDANTDTRDQFVAQMKDQRALLESTAMAYENSSFYTQRRPSVSAAESKQRYTLPPQSRSSSFSGNPFPMTGPYAAYRRRIAANLKRQPSSSTVVESSPCAQHSNLVQPKFALEFDNASTSSLSNSSPPKITISKPILIPNNFNESYAFSAPDNFPHNMQMPVTSKVQSNEGGAGAAHFINVNYKDESQMEVDTKHASVISCGGTQPYFSFSDSFDSCVEPNTADIFSYNNNAQNLNSQTAFGL